MNYDNYKLATPPEYEQETSPDEPPEPEQFEECGLCGGSGWLGCDLECSACDTTGRGERLK